MTHLTGNTVTTDHIVGQWGTFEELKGSILPRMFGHMVVLATPVVREYHGDLYHDATWLRENVTGPLEFSYMVRTSGTNLGASADSMLSIGAPGAVFYTLRLHSEDNRVWWLSVTQHETAN